MFRGSKRAFDYDAIALELAKELILTEPQLLKELKTFEYLNILSPLLHSENKDDVQLCLNELTGLLSNSTANPDIDVEVIEHIENTMEYGRDHLQILEKFQRYPHRN